MARCSEGFLKDVTEEVVAEGEYHQGREQEESDFFDILHGLG